MTLSSLKICSWNVNGIHTPIKRRKVLTYLKKEGVHIALLQETHLDDTEHLKLQQGGFGQPCFSSFTSRSRGVVILFQKNLPFKVEQCIKDKNGRYIIVKGELYGEMFAILNVYYPPGHPSDFLATAFSELADLNIRNTFVGGDLNCHLNPCMDKFPVGKTFSHHAKFINGLCEDLDYIDVWRAQHPADREYTFFSKVHKCHTRIDYFFIPNILLQSVTCSSIGSAVISDHAAVFIQYQIRNPAPQTRFWRFNPFILADHKFVSYFSEEFQSFLSINSASTNDPSLLWETSKAFARGLIISYVSSKRRRQAEQRKILESKLKVSEREYIARPSPTRLKEVSALRSALDSLLTEHAEAKIRFAKQRLYEQGDKAGRYLAYLTRKKSDSKTITSIIDDTGKQVFDHVAINSAFKIFYENLYRSDLQQDSSGLMDTFFSSLDFPQLTDDQRTKINAPITKEEVMIAINALPSGKAPGPDGLSSEFYKEFQGLLIEPLLNMLTDSLEKGILPSSLREANISLILKKGKEPEQCASYRPISLLNVDLKILSKILATRLEDLLPVLINEDQTGFIKGRNSCNNMRRLLNTIQKFHKQSIDGVVVSLDAQKAFDRVEMPFLFHVLEKFGLGVNFINWVRLLYNNPLSSVLTNGLRSSNFAIQRGTRQGCPLSPLLFALVIEPLAEAVRRNEGIHGLSIGDRQHKITLYADDVLIFLTDPEISTPNLLNIITKFSEFSGYKINLDKSEAMPLGSLLHQPNPPYQFPFKWSPSGFVYLGIHITPDFDKMYKANFPPLLERIRLDLERWNTLPISWLGRVALLKMNVLPRLLYPIQMIPVLLSHKTLKSLKSWFSSFIWAKKKPRLSLATLCLPSSEGGLDLPDIKKYQLSAHLRYITDWKRSDPMSIWLDIESSMSNLPLPNLLFIRKSLRATCHNPITIHTVKAWQAVRRLEGRHKLTSVFTPICHNTDFPPGVTDPGFQIWKTKGISRLRDLFDGHTLMSFEQLRAKFDISNQDFFRYLQIRNFIKKDTTLLSDQSSSCIERNVFSLQIGHSIGFFYRILKEYAMKGTLHLKVKWESELGVEITDDEWDEAWENVRSLSICNKVKAIQLKILHRAHISPSQRHKFNSNLSPHCPKCKTEIGTLTHCLWSCRKIKHFWRMVERDVSTMLGTPLDFDPLCMLLGISNCSVSDKYKGKLCRMLFFCARKCILLNWISDNAPSRTQWHNVIIQYVSLDYLTCKLHEKDNIFRRIWEPFMSFIGINIETILIRGFM